jgi:MFS family permease
MTPRLVGDDLMPSAQALNQVVWNTTALIGPALAGLLIQQTSVAWAYGVDVLSAVAMFVAVTRIRPMRPEGVEVSGTRRQAIREGFAYVKRNRLLQSTFVIDIIAMVFGLPRALFTFLAVEQFGHGPEIVGFLFAAPAIGAVLGAASSGWVRHIRRQGDAVVWAVTGWGAAIVVFGLSGDRLWLGLLALALAGWADVISAIFRSTILQTATPDHLRGRISGIHILVVTGGPRLGDLEAGLVAAWTTPMFSVVSGGVVCIAGAWLTALAYPELRRYRAATRVEGSA